MQRELFNDWLRQRAFNNLRVISDNKSRCARVERDLNVDLDAEYTRDRLAHVLELLTYSKEDERNHRALPGNIQMARPCSGLRSLKTAVNNYLAFRQGQGLTLPRNADTTSFDALKAAFSVWLEDDLARNTIASYRSNLTTLRDIIDSEKGNGWFDGIADAFRNHNGTQVQNLCLECQNFIFTKKREDFEHRNAWSDKASAYNQFIDFLSEHYGFEDLPAETQQPTAVPAATHNSEPFELNHAQLRNKFFNSLKSQSRYYPNNDIRLLFPARLINKIFGYCHDNRFKEWVMADVNNMVFLGENRQNRFSEIQSLNFDGHGEIRAHIHNDNFILYTRALDHQRNEYFRPANAVLPKELSVDHVTPLENIMRQNRNNLPSLRTITNHFNEWNAEMGSPFRPRDEKDWYVSFFSQHRDEYTSPNFRDLIMRDLQLLDMEYELMETRENSRMGNR